MSNDIETDLNEDPGVRLEVTLWPEDSSQKALRQIGLGISPLVLLEVDLDDETNEMVFQIQGSLVDTNKELVELLESFLTVLQSGLAQADDA